MKARGPFCIRHAAADTFAMVVFCFISGMIIEIFISGMTFEQSLASRTLSIPVNIAIAWPYGVFRDFIQRDIILLYDYHGRNSHKRYGKRIS